MHSDPASGVWTLSRRSAMRPRVWPLVGTLMLVALLVGLRQTGWIAFSTKPSLDLVWIVAVANLAIYLAIRLACRWDLFAQLVAITALVMLQAVAYLLLRVDGFTGDGRLILAWRWTPTAATLFERQATATTQSRSQVAKLDVISPDDVPGFRGADRTGAMRSARFGTDWRSQPPRELWRKRVGAGWSSFAVVGDYALTQEQRGSRECVVCYQISTGEQVWQHRDQAAFYEFTSGAGPRATPTIDAGRVYTLGATGILNCLDGHDGGRIWSVDLAETFQVAAPLFGYTGSPLVDEDLVIVEVGGATHSVAAFDRSTGAKRWVGGDAAASCCSLQAAVIGGTRQILCFNQSGLVAHDAGSGAVLWQHSWPCENAEVVNVCQPVVLPGQADELSRILISSGYGRGSAVVAVSREGESWQTEVIWSNKQLKSKFSGVVVRDGQAFGLDEGILACVDIATGERRWKRGRYGYGQLVLVNDLLVVQAESGEIVVLPASAEAPEELCRLSALAERTWSYPVICGRRLLVRNDREAACYELPPVPDDSQTTAAAR